MIKRTRSKAPANKQPRRTPVKLAARTSESSAPAKTPRKTSGSARVGRIANALREVEPITPSAEPAIRAAALTDWLPKFVNFISHLVIESKETGQTILGKHIYGAQRRALLELNAGLSDGVRSFTYLKSRQLGITTIFLAVDLFWLFMHPGIYGVLVTDDESNRDKFRLILRQYSRSLPRNMRYEIVDDNKTLMSWNVGGKLSVLDFLVAGKRKGGNLGVSRAYRFAHLCMAPGTPVILQDGRIKPIEDVYIGDTVLTHTGQPATVVDAFGQPNTKGPMRRITPWMGQPLTCSVDHTIPTQRGVIPASALTKDDMLLMPVRVISAEGGTYSTLPDSRRSRNNNQGPRSSGADACIYFTENVGFAVGYYLAEGSMIFNSYDGRPCGITFTRHRNEKPYADRAVEALQQFTSGHRATVDRSDSLTSTETIYSTALAEWFFMNFGAKQDKIIPDFVFTWGTSFCRGLLTGLLSGDGSKSQIYAGKYPINYMVLPTTRSSIATQARDIAAALGYGWAAIRYKEAKVAAGRVCKPQWRLSWSGSAAKGLRELIGLPVVISSDKGERSKYRIDDNIVFIRIKKIEDGVDEPEMWDLSIDHADHTFRTPYGSVGNTEVAKYGDERGVESFIQTLSETHPDRLFVYESTAEGFNHYSRMWKAAQQDEETQRAIFIGWWAREDQRIEKTDPRYVRYMDDPWDEEETELRDAVAEHYGIIVEDEQLAWYRWRAQTRSLDEGMMMQEQPWTEKQAFVLTGRSFFPLRKVERDLAVVTDGNSVTFKAFRYFLGNDISSTSIEQVYNLRDAELRVWEEPLAWGRYAIGCDPAYGRADWNDSHAIQVFRCFADRLIQVAEYGSTEPESFQVTWALAHLASMYKDCYINLEVSGPGMAIFTEMRRMKQVLQSQAYAQVVEAKDWGDILDGVKWYLYHRPDSLGRGFAYNWKTNFDNKVAIMNEIRDSYINEALVIRSVNVLEQMQYVVQDGNDIGPAAKGRSHDDFVFASAFAHRAWLEWIRPSMIQENYTYAEAMKQDALQLAGIQPSPIAGLVGHWFDAKAKERAEAGNNGWASVRGFK